MQIILMEKVVNLGNLGDLVKVKDGYARNFLFPQGKAKRATPAAKQEFEVRRAKLEKAAQAKLETAREFAVKLEGLLITVARRAGADGRLFGSVNKHDVSDGLKALGFDIEKATIRMPMGPLKVVGETTLDVALHTDVLATIKVAVVGER